MTIGEKIKSLRTEKGITQEVLAENLNVSRSAIAKWETNSGVPEVSNLIMISKLFDISVDELLDDKKKRTITGMKVDKKIDSGEYAGKYYDIELNGWNDGVFDVFILGEDEEFLFYQKPNQNRSVYGMIGKKYILSVKVSKRSKRSHDKSGSVNRNYFCGKSVRMELASKEGFIKGFFDFRNDDYLAVVINSFSESKILLKYGKEVNISDVSKIEELIL
ncbi:helix-turn-helix transcriptional regulator [Clostridium sp. HBUAS56010]|uniref:helix-turn-helix domain-containing protein n=1 Tax=Clostridium sp. HBUAS56010 TaxID=2571127 RepID=UPI0011779503|nr:helix-turn-helix transcriptional regulator [Clostridium sp. HBUAS56010]